MMSLPPSEINCLIVSTRVSTEVLFRYCATVGIADGPCLATARTSLGVCAATNQARNRNSGTDRSIYYDYDGTERRKAEWGAPSAHKLNMNLMRDKTYFVTLLEQQLHSFRNHVAGIESVVIHVHPHELLG